MLDINVINESTTEKKIRINVSADDFKKNYDAKIEKLKKTIKLDGFRKGKVPVALIKKRFSKSIKAEVTEALLDSSYQEYLRDCEDDILTQPTLDNLEKKEKDGFSYELSYEFIPKFDFSNYKDLDLEIEKEVFTDELLEKYINDELLPRYKEPVETEENDIKEDSVLKVNMESEDENFQKTDYILELGKFYVDEINKELLNHKVGDEVSVKFKRDEKDIEVKVKISKIMKFETPSFDEDFVQKHFARGDKSYTLENFRKDLTDDYKLALEQKNNALMIEKYFDILVDKYNFDIPKTILTASEDMLFNSKKEKEEEKEDFIKNNQEDIIKIAKRQILTSRITKEEELMPTNDDMNSYLSNMSRQYGIGMKELNDFLSKDRNQYNMIIEQITNKKLEKFVVDNNKMVDVSQKENKEVQTEDN